MSKINESPKWEAAINQIARGERVEGGRNGAINVQAQALANRTLYLKVFLEMLNSISISSGNGVYDTVEQAQKAIDDGQELRQFFNIVDIGDNAWVRRYENVEGVVTPTDEFMPNGTFIDQLSKQVADAKRTSLQTIETIPNDQGIEFGITDSKGKLLFGVTGQGDTKGKTTTEFNESLKKLDSKIGTPLQAKSTLPNSLNVVYGITDAEGRLLWGVTADGHQVNPTTIDLDSRVTILESGTIGGNRLHLVIIYGQSNSTGAVNLSQNWRELANWGVYPEGYEGEMDGPAIITNADNGVQTLAPTLSDLIPLTGATFGVADGDGPARGALDTTTAYYPQNKYVAFGHGRGSSYIEQLDRPTAEEITAGNASGIAISPTSAEALMLANSQGWESITQHSFASCATPYYKGMWLIKQLLGICTEKGVYVSADAILWLQGENDAAAPAGYADKLIAFYDQYNADIKLILSQTENITFIFESSNYSWAGITDDTKKVNTHFGLNIEQLKAAQKAVTLSPRRPMYLASPRYPQTNQIHMFPHAQRWMGEQMGKVLRKINIEGADWRPFAPDYWWLEGNSIYIKMAVPVAPLQFIAPPNAPSDMQRPGQPYGFSYSGGALALSDVQIVGNELVKITFPSVPTGKTISYVKDSRVGSLCDSDATEAMFTDRSGAKNDLRNYCFPFEILM
ncbi:hypothetical protein D3C73_216150 [compost metagenome]